MNDELLEADEAQADRPPQSEDAGPVADDPTPKRTHFGLYRSRHDRYVAGVLGGLGERFRIDPTILRILVAAVAVFLSPEAPAIVPIAYAVLWVALPLRGERSLLRTAFTASSARTIAGIVVLTIVTSLMLWSTEYLVVLALIGVAWVLLAPSRGRIAATTEVATDEATLTDPSTGEVENDPQERDLSDQNDDEYAESATWGRMRRGQRVPLSALRLQRAPKAQRQPALWPLTIALLVAWTVLCVTIDQATSPGINPSWFIYGAFVIIGGVLIVSAWRGRAGWTVLLAVALIPAWLAFGVGGIGRFDGEGTRWIDIDRRPATGEQHVELGYGRLTVDVGPEALEGEVPLNLDVAMTAGTMTIRVPERTHVEFVGRTGLARFEHLHYAWFLGNAGPFGYDNYEGTGSAVSFNDEIHRTLEPQSTECSTENVSVERLDELYGWWVDQLAGYGPEPEPADFSDPTLIEIIGTPDDLQGEAVHSFGGPEGANLRQFFSNGFGALPSSAEVVDGETIWTITSDQFGRSCDPLNLPEGKTLFVTTTMGLGEIRVERY